jgi:hypothetical protein
MHDMTRLGRAWLPAVVLLAGVLALFHSFFFQGYILDANHDRRDISVPLALVCQRAAQVLSFPEWNPYIFAGTSALGSGAYVCFYPVNWLAFAFPERFLPWLLTAILIVHVGLAYACAYLLFRRLGGDSFWSTIAATMYVFSSAAVMQMTAEINFTAFVYLPLVLYLVAGAPGTRPYANMLGQALAYALLIVAGNPQLAIYGIGIAVAFGVDRALGWAGRVPRVDYRALARNAGGLGLGLMLAAPRLLPFYVSLEESGGGRVPYDVFRAMSLTRPADTLRFFMPEVLGSSLHADFFGSMNHFETFSAYVGVAGGFVALYAVLFVWRRSTAFWNVAFIGIVLMVLGTPLARVHYLGTGGAQLLYNRLAWFLPICAAVLVAVHGAAIIQRRSLLLFSLGTVGIVVASVSYLMLAHWPAEAVRASRAVTTAAAVHFGIFYVLFLGALAAARRWSEPHPVVRGLLIAPLVLDLLLVARVEADNSNAFLSPPPFFRPTREEVQAAGQLGGAGAGRVYRVFRMPPDPRFTSYDRRTINNRFIYLGLYSSSGYDNSAPARIARLYSYPVTVNRIEERIITPRSPRAAELAANALVVTENAVGFLPKALSRARLFTRYEVAAGDLALARVLDPGFDPLASVVLADEPDRPIAPDVDLGRAEITVDEGSRVEVQVTARSASILVLADTYHSGWRAAIDGTDVPILVANYAFRAVTVGPGTHRVVWRFRHPGLTAGLWLFGAGLAGCVALGVLATVEGRRGPPAGPARAS